MSPTTSHLDAGLFEHFFDRDLRRRVADVGPADRVQPPARVGALGEQDLAQVVADDGRDRDLRCDVAGDAFADGAQPLLEERVASASSTAAARMSEATLRTSSKRSFS